MKNFILLSFSILFISCTKVEDDKKHEGKGRDGKIGRRSRFFRLKRVNFGYKRERDFNF